MIMRSLLIGCLVLASSSLWAQVGSTQDIGTQDVRLTRLEMPLNRHVELFAEVCIAGVDTQSLPVEAAAPEAKDQVLYDKVMQQVYENRDNGAVWVGFSFLF